MLGSKGAVSAENQREANIEIANAKGFTRPPLLNFFMTRYTAAYANEIAGFIEAVQSGGADAHDGRGRPAGARPRRRGGAVGRRRAGRSRSRRSSGDARP